MLSKKGNQYFQENAPWKAIKEDPKKSDKAIGNLVQLIKDLATLIAPFMPMTSQNIFSQLNIKAQSWEMLCKNPVPKDHPLGEVGVLFTKVETNQIDEYKERFAGKKILKKEDHVSFPLNLKVAKILSVQPHPDADKLYVLKIDLGSEQRQLVAGLRAYLKEEELLGRNVVIVSNLKPAKLRGQMSEGMLLAADTGDKVMPLDAPNSAPGDQVFLQGSPQVNEKQIEYDTFAKLQFRVHNKKVYVDNKELVTQKEHIIADIDDGARVK